jgi:hypothetical protein
VLRVFQLFQAAWALFLMLESPGLHFDSASEVPSGMFGDSSLFGGQERFESIANEIPADVGNVRGLEHNLSDLLEALSSCWKVAQEKTCVSGFMLKLVVAGK